MTSKATASQQPNYVWPVIGQVFLATLAGMILDGGLTTAVVLICCVCHWIVVAIIIQRRGATQLTRGDLVLLRIGYLIYLAVIVVGLVLIPMLVSKLLK